MDEIEPREVLGATRLFADALDESQLAALAARSHLVVFREGAELMTEGDFGSSMFVIVSGAVSVMVADRRGAEHDIAHIGPGDIVGEMSLMTGARRSATVVAVGDVVAVEITKVALEQVFARAPDLIDRFGVVLAKRQAEHRRAAAKAEHSGEDLARRIRHFFTRR